MDPFVQGFLKGRHEAKMVTVTHAIPSNGVLSEPQIEQWLSRLAANRSASELDMLREAVEAVTGVALAEGTEAAAGQLRSVVLTADILDGLKLDTQSLVAALLSNLPARSDYDAQRIAQLFGDPVAELLRHVALIREISATSTRDVSEQSVEPLRRMLLGLADDVRALMVVLARRLARMRGQTSEPPPEDKPAGVFAKLFGSKKK